MNIIEMIALDGIHIYTDIPQYIHRRWNKCVPTNREIGRFNALP